MERLSSVETCVERTLSRLGRHIRMALPLGLGKPNHFVNALYRRVREDSSLELDIYTALTLQRPQGSSELERRFLGPLVERLFGDYPDLDYEIDRMAGRLPDRVRVREFYLQAGKYLDHARVQRDYISTNYTFVARDLMDRDINLIAQQVAVGEVDGEPRLSLSCNPDVTLDLMAMLRERAGAAAPCVRVAQRNAQLPFMYGDAVLPLESFDYLLESPELDHTLFGPPKEAVSDADYMIGLYASALVKDGGELQVGIGALGDAVVYALLLRQRDNARYQATLERLGVLERAERVIERLGALDRFDDGLFAATEMFVDGLMHLIDAGVVKRRVYDDLLLQRLLDEEVIAERVTLETLSVLRQRGAIGRVLGEADVEYLRRFGVLQPGVGFAGGSVIAPDGTRFVADLDEAEARSLLRERCLGDELRGGAIVHGGFFLGSPRFYQWLRELPEERRRLISMRSVTRINQLYGQEALYRLHRRDARFFNTGMMATLLGAVVSDGLDDGRVVSGVGGQYNFVAMAHALPDGHSVLEVRSTREREGEVHSNIVWNYGHVTIPRHLRDLVITEYGIADLRGKTDEEVIREMLNVADSRFQDGLLGDAKRSGKLAADYRIPDRFRGNTPQSYRRLLSSARADSMFPTFPFGTELTDEEVVLARVLRRLKTKIGSAPGALEALAEAVVDGTPGEQEMPYLARMGLDDAESLRDRMYQRLLVAELRRD